MDRKLLAAGLNKNEAKVYIALLALGQASVSQIAKTSKVKRTNTYHVVGGLLEKGLLQLVGGENRALYAPEKPELVLKMMRKKMEEAEKNYKEMLMLMPELESLYRKAQKVGAADSGKARLEIFSKKLQAEK